jgi:hypothetical protein
MIRLLVVNGSKVDRYSFLVVLHSLRDSHQTLYCSCSQSSQFTMLWRSIELTPSVFVFMIGESSSTPMPRRNEAMSLALS